MGIGSRYLDKNGNDVGRKKELEWGCECWYGEGREWEVGTHFRSHLVRF